MPTFSKQGKSIRSFVVTALRCPAGFEFADRLQFKPFQRWRDRDWVNRCGFDEWKTSTEDLSDADLRRLLEVVVLAERDFGWIGGSAASGIWLFTLLCKRDEARREEIADWVFRNRGDNPYVPLGTSIPGARSWREAQQVLQAFRDARAARRAAGESKEEAYRAVGAARRKAALEHRDRTAARNKRRQDQVAELAGLTFVDRVEAFLGWPLPRESFPITALSQAGDDYALLPRTTLLRLRAAIGKRRGDWRRLAETIEKALTTT